MTIGELARRSGVHLETIRYYERINLMPEPARSPGGHRRYSGDHLSLLEFIRRGRALGFGLAAIQELLRLAQPGSSCCAAASELTATHLQTVREKIEELQRLEARLAETLEQCRPENNPIRCPVIDLLADAAPA